MLKTEISQRKKVILFTLMIILNIVLRIPSIPHEKGSDSFFIHTLSNSVTTFGTANWWAHWLSIFGLYPYSYASSIPFSLSGVAQTTGLTGVQMENTILLYCIFLGLFSIFVAYVFAGAIYNDFLFKYLMALVFSISQGVMIFSTWEISARGPFIILLPLFIFLILKKIHNFKKLTLIGLLGLFLASTHHYFWFLIPLVAIFILLKTLYVSSTVLKKRSWIKKDYLNYLYLFSFISVLSYPFLTHSMIKVGSRYSYLIDMFIINTRWTGILIIFSFAGMIYLSLKKSKKIEEWYLLVAFTVFIPFAYNQTYGMYLILIYVIFFINVALRNILNVNKQGTRKAITVIIVSSILMSSLFSAFYNNYRTSRDSWYMDENTYQTGLWINKNIDTEKDVITDGRGLYAVRVIAVQSNGSSMISGGVMGLANNFIEKQFIYDNLIKVPMTSSYFYDEGAYRVEERDKYRDITWYMGNKHITEVKERYNCEYFLHSLGFTTPRGIEEENIGVIYTSGILKVYELENI